MLKLQYDFGWFFFCLFFIKNHSLEPQKVTKCVLLRKTKYPAPDQCKCIVCSLTDDETDVAEGLVNSPLCEFHTSPIHHHLKCAKDKNVSTVCPNT